MNYGSFLEMLSNILLPDQNIRQQAEALYLEFVYNRPSLAISYMLEILLSDSNNGLKSRTLIFLYQMYQQRRAHLLDLVDLECHNRVISSLHYFFSLSEIAKTQPDQIPYAVALISAYYFDRDAIPDFPQSLLQFAQLQDTQISIMSLETLSQLVKRTKQAVSVDVEAFIGLFMVRDRSPVFSLKLLRLFYSLAQLQSYKYLIQVSDIIPTTISQLPDEHLFTALSDLLVAIILNTSFFVPSLFQVTKLVITYAADETKTDLIRLKAIEILSQLVKQNPEPMCNISEQICHLLISLANLAHHTEESEELSLAEYALIQLKTCLQISPFDSYLSSYSLTLCDQLLSSDNQSNQLTAINILPSLSQHIPLQHLTQRLIPFFNHESPIIRSQSYISASSLSSEEILNSLFEALHSETIPKCKSALMLSLSYIISSLPYLTTQPYISQILPYLFTDIKKNSLRLLSAIAVTAPEELSLYFEDISNLAFRILSDNFFDKESYNKRGIFRARAIELLVLVGCYIDPTDFAPHATRLLQIIAETDFETISDVEFNYVSIAVDKLVKSVPCVVQNYIDLLMPKLISISEKTVKPIVHKAFVNDVEPSANRFIFLMGEGNIVEYHLEDVILLCHCLRTVCSLIDISGSEKYLDSLEVIFMEHSRSFSTDLQSQALLGLSKISEKRLSEEFEDKFCQHLLSLLSFERGDQCFVTILKLLRKGLKKLIHFEVVDGDILKDILESFTNFVKNLFTQPIAESERLSIEFAAGNLLKTFFVYFPDVTRTYFEEELSSLLVLDSDKVCVLACTAWTDYVKVISSPDESLIDVLITCIHNLIGCGTFVACQSGFLNLGYLIETGLLVDEVIRETPAVIMSTVSLLEESGLNSRCAIDGALVVMAIVLQVGTELVDRENCQSFFIHTLPLQTEIDDSNRVYEYFCDLAEETIKSEVTADCFIKYLDIISSAISTTSTDTQTRSRLVSIANLLLKSEYSQRMIDQLPHDKKVKFHRAFVGCIE